MSDLSEKEITLAAQALQFKYKADAAEEFLIDLGIKLATSGIDSKPVVEAVKAISAFTDGTDPKRLLGGETLIARERLRQIKEEKHDPEHDKNLRFGELSLLACYYALWDCSLRGKALDDIEAFLQNQFPEDLKPKDHLRNLVRAGALIAAEIDRVLADEEARQKTKRR